MSRKFNYERASRALVDALHMGDEGAAEKHDVSVRSIQRWRSRMDDDDKLAEFVAYKKGVADKEWAEELPSAIRSSVRYIRESVKEARLGDPDALHSVVRALKVLTEVAMVREILDARLANQRRQDG